MNDKNIREFAVFVKKDQEVENSKRFVQRCSKLMKDLNRGLLISVSRELKDYKRSLFFFEEVYREKEMELVRMRQNPNFLEVFNKEAPEIADIQIKLSPEDFKGRYFEQMSSKHKESDGEPIEKDSVLGRLMTRDAPLEAFEKGLFEDLVIWIDGVKFSDIINEVRLFEFDSSKWERGIRFFLAMILARVYKGVGQLIAEADIHQNYEALTAWKETKQDVFGLIDRLQLELL